MALTQTRVVAGNTVSLGAKPAAPTGIAGPIEAIATSQAVARRMTPRRWDPLCRRPANKLPCTRTPP